MNIIGAIRARVTAILGCTPKIAGGLAAFGTVASPVKSLFFDLLNIKTFYVLIASENHFGTISFALLSR